MYEFQQWSEEGAMPDTLLPMLLAAQGLIGGIDTLVNHEWITHLPQRAQARTEVGIHVLREASYGLLFAALAWLSWHGAWVALVGMLLLAAILIDAWDEFIENRMRILPQNERILHFLLNLNLGCIVVTLAPLLATWWSDDTGLRRIDHGMLSWVLTLFATAALGWAARDFLAWRKLRRETAKGGRD